VEFTFPPEAEALRAELRAWLDENFTEEFRGGNPMAMMMGEQNEHDVARARAWGRKLYEGGWAVIEWPVEHGGRGATAAQQIVFAEEMQRAGAPMHPGQLGITHIGPAVVTFGSEEQRERILPRMLGADDIWCQGFSEPDAGSDLASMRTRAEEDGDEFVINGHKTWNSGGHLADWCELLVRTDPSTPRHGGISCLVVDMHSPGVEVRPIQMLSGHAGVCDIFFTDVRVPKSALLGPLNEGWRVAHTTLAHERGTVANLHHDLRARIDQLLEAAKTIPFGPDGAPASEDRYMRQRLARSYVRAEILKLTADRQLAGQLAGAEPGPETAVGRFVWQEVSQEIPELEAELLGPDALIGDQAKMRVGARANTIAGGTREIHMNNLAYRGLGLPKSY
jgi:alkylation response protein AidB-like acyl-CoA dehydrogenase